jgi:hypothetical protein
MFLLVSIAILALAIPLAPRSDRADLWVTGGGAGALAGLGLLSMFIGPRPLAVDTSADAFMRRADLTSELASQFRSRLGHHIARYVPWLTLPLAWFGRKGTRGLTRALLEAWAWLCLAGVTASFVIGSIPGVRMIAFAFPLPILAALGVAWLRLRISSRAVGIAVAGALVALMLSGAGLTWARERPYADPLTVDQVQRAGDLIGQQPASATLVFVVDGSLVDESRSDLAAYRTTNWGNILRAYLPADRIEDLHIYFGTAENLLADRPTPSDDPTKDALSRLYWQDLQASALSERTVYRLSSMTREAREPMSGVTDVISDDAPIASQIDPRLPEPRSIVLAGLAMFLALTLIGAGWARTITRESDITLALAPAFGAAALILVGVLLDRLGVRLDGPVVPIAGIAVALGGYLAAWVSHRKVEPATLTDATT